MRPGGRTLERGRNRRSPSPGGCLSLDEPLTGQTPANEHERTFASFGWAVACSAAVLPREGSYGAAPDACRPRRTSLCMRTYVSINKLKLHPLRPLVESSMKATFPWDTAFQAGTGSKRSRKSRLRRPTKTRLHSRIAPFSAMGAINRKEMGTHPTPSPLATILQLFHQGF